MISNDILFIGIGQAGNNIVSTIAELDDRINTLLINTSRNDFARIRNIPKEQKYAIPLATGTAQDREKAMDYLEQKIKIIYDKIMAFEDVTSIYFAFSMGGGTGSGMTPYLIKALHQLGFNKKINIVPILPFASESKLTFQNTLDCWNDIVDNETGILKYINSIYLIDNNKRDSKSEINIEFASLFTQLLNITDSHPEHVIDEDEIGYLANAHGLSAIISFNDNVKRNEIESELSEAIADSIFVIDSKTFEYIGISSNENFDLIKASSCFTHTEGEYLGISETKEPLLMLSGATPTKTALSDVLDSYKLKVTEIKSKLIPNNEDATIAIQIATNNRRKRQEAKREQITIDTALKNRDDFWNKIRNR